MHPIAETAPLRPSLGRVVAVWSLALAGLGGSGACGTPVRPVRPEYDLRDPSATRRIDAVALVERTGDRSEIPVLIEMLDDDDESVRITAGATLRSMTGHDTGYRAYASEPERRAQITLWRAWWAGGRGATAPVPTAAPPVPPGYTSGGARVRSP